MRQYYDNTFESLVLPHAKALYRRAFRMSGVEADAEDIVQETMLRAFRGWNSFQQGTNCKAWLYRILHNTFINRYRRDKARPAIQACEDIESMGVQLTDELMDTQTMTRRQILDLMDDEVKQALDDLPEEFREVIWLCFVDDFSYKEVARILDIPMGTVMSRLYRGRRLLRKQLERYSRDQGFKADEVKQP